MILHRLLGEISNAFPSAAVRAAVEQLLQQTEPKLRLLSGAQRKLLRGVRLTQAHIHDFCAMLPPPLDLSVHGFSRDRRVGLLFSSPQSLSEVLQANAELRGSFARPVVDAVQLLLVMQPCQQQRLGSSLLPDGSVQRDVPQTVLSFERQRVLLVAQGQPALLQAAEQQAYAALCAVLARELAQMDEERRALQQEKQALQLQLQLGDRVLNAEALFRNGRLGRAELQQRQQEVDAALQAGAALATLNGRLQLLRELLEAPQQSLAGRVDVISLDRMGVLTPPELGGETLACATLELGYRHKRRRVVFAGQLTRADWREWQQRWPL